MLGSCRAFVALMMLGGAVGADPVIDVPSGQPVTLQDVIWNAPGDAGLAVRFRFIAPHIARNGGIIDFETALEDMDHLCTTYALPRVDTITGPMPAQVIISMSDIEVDFGVATPEATQFFEAYAIVDGACIYEGF